MSEISLNASMRSNLLSLQQTRKLQDMMQLRLSTGLKVNSAIDNPSSYYTASSLNNRAEDLSALLDAMSQGIQTIKAANEALETGTAILEQATAVIAANISVDALASKPNVMAVVTDEQELQEAVNSGRRGDIVVFGKIECTRTIELKEGQNLTGIGHYGYADSTVDKFSRIDFDFSGQEGAIGIVAGKNNTVADISFTGKMYKSTTCISFTGSKQAVAKNLDIQMDVRSLPGYPVKGYETIAVSGGIIELQGVNNVYSPKGLTNCIPIGIRDSKVTMRQDSVLNIHINNSDLRGIYNGYFNLYDNAEVNLLTSSRTLSGTFNCHDNSRLNVVGIINAGNIILNDNAQAYLQKVGVIYDTNIKIEINSVDCVLYTSSLSYHASRTLTMNAVAGSKWVNMTDNKIYSNEAAVNITTNSGPASVLPGFDEIGPSPYVKPDLTWLKQQNNKRNFDYAEPELFPPVNEYNNYVDLLDQYDAVVNDADYMGVNLLKGQDLKINFNENHSSLLLVKGSNVFSQNLGLNRQEWQIPSDALNALQEILTAVTHIRMVSQQIGSYYNIVSDRQNFTENLINVLHEGADKLTLADMNEESANLLALQTRQQLAVNSLSLASQAAQSILKLF